MARLWVRVMKRHRIAQQATVPCVWGEQTQALQQALQDMDVPVPMWLGKHEREFQSFRRTAFLPEHFVEAVSFDRLGDRIPGRYRGQAQEQRPRNQF